MVMTSSLSSGTKSIRASSIALVACNVYVSAAGRPSHAKILSSLLSQSQEQCRALREEIGPPVTTERSPPPPPPGGHYFNNSVAVVHAFADVTYNRSSFHLAGRSDLVADVASTVATSALKALDEDRGGKNNEEEEGGRSSVSNGGGSSDSTSHPNVGLVDHVAIMPLCLPTPPAVNSDESRYWPEEGTCVQDEDAQREAAGRAAVHVGRIMSALGCVVHYYGSASDDNASLASVRRNLTRFFQSGGLSPAAAPTPSSHTGTDTHHHDNDPRRRGPSPKYGVSCVGAPPNFVENYNIRLSSGGRHAATSLCRSVRERDGGLPGVEGLTLPYSLGQYEVACNLLSPNVGSREAIRRKAEQWVVEYNSSIDAGREAAEIDLMYGVGTTQRQCLEVLQMKSEQLKDHDELVAKGLLEDFL